MKRQSLFTICVVLVLAANLAGIQPVSAQTMSAGTSPATSLPLEQLLNSNGTLDLERGFQGSLDPTGWQMVTSPNGEPRFAPASTALQAASSTQQLMAVPGDENWDDRFSTPGPNGSVGAIAISGSHVYVGGYFTTAGDIAANNIAKWDGTSWSALGGGTDGYVYAISVSGSDVYVGGGFGTAGGVAANHIAKWDGTSWSALGGGLNSSVYAIAVSGSDVYAGGQFTTAGGVAANHIAKWDGTSWSALGSGTNNYFINAVAVSGGEVYAGGNFTTAGGVPANHIAKWDGTSWSPLGSGTDGYMVNAIAVSGSDVYAGGDFNTAGGVWAFRIAKWDGTGWSALGSGVNGYYYGSSVNAIAVSGSDVYAGGYQITGAGGVRVNDIAKWDGTSWSALGSGLTGGNYYSSVSDIAISDSEVYAGGLFTIAGGVPASYIAKWDGTSWSGLHSRNPNGLNRGVSAVAISGSDVYAGGEFTTAGGVPANHIAKWDGTSWSALGSGLDGYYVKALAVSGSEVYAGGWFTTAGGGPANHIAKWDGTSWSALGSGLNNAVSAIAVSGSDVYVGGDFTTAGAVAANHIAKWDGTSWSALGSGLSGGDYSAVSAIAVSGSEVYVGGYFTTAGGVPANRIAKWNGTSWSALGSGLNNAVSAIAVSGSDVYAGGEFTTAGGGPANHIAKWDGTSWSALGSGTNGSFVYAIAVSSSEVYVGGWFTTAGSVPANYIAKWDGTSWSALGSGMNNTVFALAVSSSEVYAGGWFSIAGGKPSSYFGRYVLNQPPTAEAGGPYSVDEGTSVTVTATGSDPEAGPLTYAWDLDSNGSFETPSQGTTFSALDGPSNHTITVQVTDEGGLTATASTTVDVLNVAPTADFTNTPSTLFVGQSATVAFSNPSDPSAADTTTGFQYSYDCTNDGSFELSDTAATSYVCAYPASGTFTSSGRIQDKDGDFTDYTVQITVLTPREGAEGLIEQVQSLIVQGTLSEGNGNALIAKLDGAIKQLEKGKTKTAVNELQAFISQVNDFMNSTPPILTPADGQPLIDAANAIIVALGG